MTPTYLLSDWCSSLVLRTRVYTLNIISVSSINLLERPGDIILVGPYNKSYSNCSKDIQYISVLSSQVLFHQYQIYSLFYIQIQIHHQIQVILPVLITIIKHFMQILVKLPVKFYRSCHIQSLYRIQQKNSAQFLHQKDIN